MLKNTMTPITNPKATDIAIPSLESITTQIRNKIPALTETQVDELAKAVHARCMEFKQNPPARIVTTHITEFCIKRAPSKRVMYWSMGYPGEYTIRPIEGECLPKETCFRVMKIPIANRIILHYVDNKMNSEYYNINLKW